MANRTVVRKRISPESGGSRPGDKALHTCILFLTAFTIDGYGLRTNLDYPVDNDDVRQRVQKVVATLGAEGSNVRDVKNDLQALQRQATVRMERAESRIENVVKMVEPVIETSSKLEQEAHRLRTDEERQKNLEKRRCLLENGKIMSPSSKGSNAYRTKHCAMKPTPCAQNVAMFDSVLTRSVWRYPDET